MIVSINPSPPLSIFLLCLLLRLASITAPHRRSMHFISTDLCRAWR